MQRKTGVDTTRRAIQEFNQGYKEVGAGTTHPSKLFRLFQNCSGAIVISTGWRCNWYCIRREAINVYAKRDDLFTMGSSTTKLGTSAESQLGTSPAFPNPSFSNTIRASPIGDAVNAIVHRTRESPLETRVGRDSRRASARPLTPIHRRRHTGCEVQFRLRRLDVKQVGPERLERPNLLRLLRQAPPKPTGTNRISHRRLSIDRVVNSHSVSDIESFLLALANHQSKLQQLYAREI